MLNKIDYEKTTIKYLAMIETALKRSFAAGKIDSSAYQIVLDAMDYSTQAGGKRIRPILTLEFCRVCGGDLDKALPFAAAIEMIHASSLIHDDLPCMDNDDLRRGKPSCHIQFGEANALLAGDALLLMAFEVIACSVQEYGVDPACAANGIAVLSHFSGAHGMVGGQVIDLASENKQIPEATLKQMHELKTAALIKAACMMGCIAAGASKEKIDIAERYALLLGRAFQIIDDILDVTGTAKQLGKPIGSDNQNHKVTYVSLYGLKGAQQLAQSLSEEALSLLEHFDDHAYLTSLTTQLLKRDQ